MEPQVRFTSSRPPLFVRETGEGPPVVVLHGGPDFDLDYLLPELDALGQHVRLAYYDQAGRGRSTRGVRPDHVGIESDVADVDRVRQDLGRDAVALLGHSWGALLAVEYARRHPQRLTHLILLNAAPVSHGGLLLFREHLALVRDPDDAESLRRLEGSPAYRAGDLVAEAEWLRLHFTPAFADPSLLARLLPRLRRHDSPEQVLRLRVLEQRLDEDTWASPDYDLLPELATLEVPTLVIHGDHDFIPVAVAEGTGAAIPGARLVVLPRCGHFSYIEATDAVVAEVRALMGA